MKVYGLGLNWEYQILASRGYSHELIPNDHIRSIRDGILKDSRMGILGGVDYAWGVCAVLKAIMYNCMGAYHQQEERSLTLDFGDTMIYSFTFPKYMVIRSDSINLPEKATFSGAVTTRASGVENERRYKAEYRSVFSKFRVQEISKERANNYLIGKPHLMVPIIVDFNFIQVHRLMTLVGVVPEDNSEDSEVERTIF